MLLQLLALSSGESAFGIGDDLFEVRADVILICCRFHASPRVYARRRPGCGRQSGAVPVFRGIKKFSPCRVERRAWPRPPHKISVPDRKAKWPVRISPAIDSASSRYPFPGPIATRRQGPRIGAEAPRSPVHGWRELADCMPCEIL